jgi:hypothetical protein
MDVVMDGCGSKQFVCGGEGAGWMKKAEVSWIMVKYVVPHHRVLILSLPSILAILRGI